MTCVKGTDTLPAPAGPPEKTWVSTDGNIILTYNQIKVGSNFALKGVNGFAISGIGSDLPTIYHKLNLKTGTSEELFYKVWTIPGRGTFEGLGEVHYWGMINGQYDTGSNKGSMALLGTGAFEGESLILTFTVGRDWIVTISGTLYSSTG